MPPTDTLELPGAPAPPAFADNGTKTLTRCSRGFLQFVGASAASLAPVQGLLLLQGLFHCKRIQVGVKPVFQQQMWSVLKRSLSRAHECLLSWEEPPPSTLSESFVSSQTRRCLLREGTSLFPAVVAAAAEQQLGLFLGTTCVLLRPQQPLGLQLRSQGPGTAETFNRRSTGFKDVIQESSRQDKEIKALWPQRDVLLCVWLSAFVKNILSLTQSQV